MTSQEVWINLGLGVISGIISGIITGFGVSIYYRKKDSIQQWSRQLFEDKQNMSQYINEIKYELDQIISNPDLREFTYLRRLLVKPPKFLSFRDDKIEKEYHNTTITVYKMFEEIEVYLNMEKVELDKLSEYRRTLVNVQFDILRINTKPIITEVVK
jgi:cellulose biosynthesis protein BcsQ